jgi:hypothetical protein
MLNKVITERLNARLKELKNESFETLESIKIANEQFVKSIRAGTIKVGFCKNGVSEFISDIMKWLKVDEIPMIGPYGGVSEVESSPQLWLDNINGHANWICSILRYPQEMPGGHIMYCMMYKDAHDNIKSLMELEVETILDIAEKLLNYYYKLKDTEYGSQD